MTYLVSPHAVERPASGGSTVAQGSSGRLAELKGSSRESQKVQRVFGSSKNPKWPQNPVSPSPQVMLQSPPAAQLEQMTPSLGHDSNPPPPHAAIPVATAKLNKNAIANSLDFFIVAPRQPKTA
jgi:hypothetical protein